MIGIIEEQLLNDNIPPLWCGTDEVGRGPLAGPVTAAAVVFAPDATIPNDINDSKQLSEKKRESLAIEIQNLALAYAVTDLDAGIIDDLNILQASLEAMKLSIRKVAQKLAPNSIHFILIDGNKRIPELEFEQQCFVKGDANSYHIAAASILAKVHRDHLMTQMDAIYPGYGFAKNKGYPTKTHRDALLKLGPCPIHRRSFNGVVIQKKLF